jgi:hypothetical protein
MRELQLGISINKASSSLFVLTFWRGGKRLSPAFSNVLPRRETEEECLNAGSFNKHDNL